MVVSSMPRKTSDISVSVASRVAAIASVHFFLVVAYALAIIVSDAWNLIAPELVLQRWTAAALMLVATTIIWYAARYATTNRGYYHGLAFILVAQDIAMASFNVYTQRGMASRAVMLYAIPIIVSAVLLSRSALYATAAVCTAAYGMAAVKYFVTFPGEGYKVELYTEVGFYSAMFFVLAALLSVVVRRVRQD